VKAGVYLARQREQEFKRCVSNNTTGRGTIHR
jgi:hypothetical protein